MSAGGAASTDLSNEVRFIESIYRLEAGPAHDEPQSTLLGSQVPVGYTAYVPASSPGRGSHPAWALAAALALLLVLPAFVMSAYALARLCGGAGCLAEGALPAGLMPGTRPVRDGEDWSYDDLASWPELCRMGRAQSPINIITADATKAPSAESSINRHAFQVVGDEIPNGFSGLASALFNGHAIETDSIDEYLLWAGETYRLAQFHFHTPSEHLIDGKQFDAEIHFVHQSISGKFLVMAVLAEAGGGSAGAAFVREIANRTSAGAAGQRSVVTLDFERVLKELGVHKSAPTGYWSYEGSLTTPPCSEGVQWIVLQQHVTIAAGDIAELQSIEKRNVRPAQELNGRVIYSKKD